MRRTRRALAAIAVPATALALVLAGCSGQTSTAGGSSSAGSSGGSATDTLTLGMTADINGWDPSAQPPYQAWGIEAVYDQLVQCDTSGGIIPEAAESWEISPDNTSFTAHLRPGQKFSDGTPVDAAAVQASFEPLIKSASDRYGGITFASPDANTITITWPEPQPLLNNRVCSPQIASAKYLASGDLNTAPVGSGPYVFNAANSTSGSIYSFDKNPSYWGADKYPYEHLELRVLADETASLNALKTGQIDGTLITPALYDQAKAAGMSTLQTAVGIIQFQLTDRAGEKIPALGNLKVRQAMNMVLDEQAISDQLFQGHAKPVHQIFGETSQAYIKDLGDPYPYDVDKAKQLMQESGFGDGFTLTVPTMEGQPWLPILPYVTQQLGLLNIKVEQKALSGPDAINQLISGDYPAPLWGLGGSSDSIQDISIQVLDTGFWNVSHQPDATIDALWQKIVTGTEDEKVAAQQEINKYVTENAWFVPIVAPFGFYAYSNAVSVPQMSDPNGGHPLLRDFQKN
jgi:ABC-type transport system substrate-binding protein